MKDPEYFILKEDESPCIFGSIEKQRWSYACAKQLIERLIYGQLIFTLNFFVNFFSISQILACLTDMSLLQLRVLRMAWSSLLCGLLTGLDLEWISFLVLMVQVRVFQGFLPALAMLGSFSQYLFLP